MIFTIQDNVNKAIKEIVKINNYKNKEDKFIKKEIEILIWGIKRNSFNFTNNGKFDDEEIGNVNIEGIYYSENNEIYLNITFIIDKKDKPVKVKFTVFINNKKRVICNPDIYNNNIIGVTAKKLEFDLNNNEENMKNGKVEDGLYNI